MEGIYQMADHHYHADPVEHGSFSSSIGRLLLERSPLHAWHAHPRLNPAWRPRVYDSATQKRLDFGSAVHCLVLEPALAATKVLTCPFDDWRKTEAKDMRAQARADNQIPMLDGDYTIATQVALAVWKQLEHTEIGEILLSGGKSEQVAIWTDEGTGMTCRSRMDWLADDCSLILDLKTTSGSAEPEAYARNCLPEAEIQAALYRRGISTLFPDKDPAFVFACVEDEPPYALSLVAYDPTWSALAEDKLSEALDLWAKCMKTRHWPGYPKRICYAAPPAYLQQAWDERISKQVDALMAHPAHARGLQI